jgi:hypothetical protein
MKSKPITDAEIEKFFNRDREPDVPYCFIRNISPKHIKLIKEILINKKK